MRRATCLCPQGFLCSGKNQQENIYQKEKLEETIWERGISHCVFSLEGSLSILLRLALLQQSPAGSKVIYILNNSKHQWNELLELPLLCLTHFYWCSGMKTAFPIAAADGTQGQPEKAASDWGEEIWAVSRYSKITSELTMITRGQAELVPLQTLPSWSALLEWHFICLNEMGMGVMYLNAGHLGCLVTRGSSWSIVNRAQSVIQPTLK